MCLDRVSGLVVHQFQPALLALPFRVATGFESQPACDVVLVFQRFPERDLEATAVAPFEGVLSNGEIQTPYLVGFSIKFILYLCYYYLPPIHGFHLLEFFK